MDASYLVVRGQSGLVLSLEILETEDVEVELVGVVSLQLAKLPTEGDGSCTVSVTVSKGATPDGSGRLGKGRQG
jgi:hypothetical protein